jgi:hypothetical protein
MQSQTQPAQIIPFPRAKRPTPGSWRVTIDGEYSDDDVLPPEMFDDEDDNEELAVYVQIADRWPDRWND